MLECLIKTKPLITSKQNAYVTPKKKMHMSSQKTKCSCHPKNKMLMSSQKTKCTCHPKKQNPHVIPKSKMLMSSPKKNAHVIPSGVEGDMKLQSASRPRDALCVFMVVVQLTESAWHRRSSGSGIFLLLLLCMPS
jgi:hypothetical protein